jgi:hypothetical protein
VIIVDEARVVSWRKVEGDHGLGGADESGELFKWWGSREGRESGAMTNREAF